MIPDHWVTDPLALVAAMALGSALTSCAYEIARDVRKALNYMRIRRLRRRRYVVTR
jgi:hypothetical protein